MAITDFPTWLQTTFLLAPTLSAVTALIAFLFAVVSGWRRDRREGSRRDWDRLQLLAQTLFNGDTAGRWAQLLAVRELGELRSKRLQALLLARQALSFWESPNTPGSPELTAELRNVINKLSD